MLRIRTQVLLAAMVSATPIFGNQAPVSLAGPDTTFKINYTIRLQGDATDDSTSVGFLTFTWAQISGPAQANILSPSTQVSRVTFPQTGEYRFQLTVSDGQLSDADTVKYTIIDSLPFIILNPVDSEQIQIGKPYTIRWRMDPSKPCRVEYSLNDGMSYLILSMNGPASDSFVWNVGAEYVDSARQGIMKVIQYPTGPLVAFGSFLLVDHPPRTIVPLASSPGGPFRIVLSADGRLSARGVSRDQRLHLRLLGADGRVLLSASVAGNATLDASASLRSSRLVVCQVSTPNGVRWPMRALAGLR